MNDEGSRGLTGGGPINIPEGGFGDIEVPWEDVGRTKSGGQGAWSTFAILICAATAAAFFLSPYFYLRQLRDSFQERKADFIQHTVDLQGISDRLFAEGLPIIYQLGSEGGTAGAELRRFLDETFTAQRVVEIGGMAQWDRPDIPVLRRHLGRWPDSKVVSLVYKNLNEVEVRFEDGVVLSMERDGFFGWRIFAAEFMDTASGSGS